MQHEHHHDTKDAIEAFLGRYYREDIARLAQGDHTLWIDYQDLFTYDVDLADDLLDEPATIMDYLEAAVHEFELPADVSLDHAHVRVQNLPAAFTVSVGEYRADTIEQAIAVRGQVEKRTAVEPLPEVAVFECQRCGTTTRIPQAGRDLQEPHECQGCERQGPFDLDRRATTWKDVQTVRLTLPPEESTGADSAHVDVRLDGDLVDMVDAGDRVTIPARHTVDIQQNGHLTCAHELDALGIEIEESDYQSIDVDAHLEAIRDIASGEYGDPYDLLVESIAPTVIGMDTIKEALALQLFGGNRVENPDGTTQRGDIHVLLLGDPGTAKSTLLQDIDHKAPCSTFASGKGATAAGMTATATKDDFGGGDQWTLKAGAMVLADGGIACIDELDKVREDAVSSLHEALEKQVVHVNKAGINAHLPTRTALLAAGNPLHGRFVDSKPIADQIDLGPTIMSRFDLMFMLDDTPDADRDAEIIEGMIANRQQAIEYTHHGNDEAGADIAPKVRTEVLRAWVAYAKQHVHPRIRDADLRADLKESYQRLRLHNGEDGDQPVPVTYRALEAHERLAEASARVRLSDEVEKQDIERAKRLFGRSMRDVGFDPDSGQLDVDIVETGVPKSQERRIQWLEDYVREHEGTEPVAHEQILDAAQEIEMSDSQTEFLIEKLKNRGELYEPSENQYRKS